jgi:hypothetical protein
MPSNRKPTLDEQMAAQASLREKALAEGRWQPERQRSLAWGCGMLMLFTLTIIIMLIWLTGSILAWWMWLS